MEKKQRYRLNGDDGMFITVAGERIEVQDNISIAELIVKQKVETPEYVTVSVNDDFINRNEFERKSLSEGDTVEFLYFMGGGSDIRLV